MISISERPICTVIVTVDAAPDTMADLVEHAQAGIDHHFPSYPGYRGGALHLSGEGTRLVQYLQWDSESDYLACRDDPRWDALETTQRFMTHLRHGRATVDARTYTVTACSGPGLANH